MGILENYERKMIRSIINTISDFVFPIYCFDCGGKVIHREPFCPLCQKIISEDEPLEVITNFNEYIHNIYSLYNFDDKIVRDAIHSLKYKRYPSPAIHLIDIKIAQIDLNTYDYIIPVPLHWRRFKDRGYNQSKIIAQTIHKYCKIPIVEGLKRSKYNKSQTKKNRENRQKSIKGIFQINKRCEKVLYNSKILIVDDVITTGATITECAKLLYTIGCTVDVFTIARA